MKAAQKYFDHLFPQGNVSVTRGQEKSILEEIVVALKGKGSLS